MHVRTLPIELTAPWHRQGIGDDADVESSSAATVQTEEGYQPVFFDPRPLKNLAPIDEMESLSPIMDLKARLSCLFMPHGGTGCGTDAARCISRAIDYLYAIPRSSLESMRLIHRLPPCHRHWPKPRFACETEHVHDVSITLHRWPTC